MASPKKQLQGLVAATITPMTENGEVNLSVVGRYVDYLVKEQGVKNVFVNGTTGEGLSLSIAERRRLAEEWVTQGRSKLEQVVVHVGALSLKESQELAQHAAEIGADGIAAITPFFLKPQSRDVLVHFLKEVAAAAPALPFYYYHIPAVTGVKRGKPECSTARLFLRPCSHSPPRTLTRRAWTLPAQPALLWGLTGVRNSAPSDPVSPSGCHVPSHETAVRFRCQLVAWAADRMGTNRSSRNPLPRFS